MRRRLRGRARAGAPRRASTRARIYLHGNAKSRGPSSARRSTAGVGHIVLDSFDDLERLERIAAESGDRRQEVLIRVTPGVAGRHPPRDLDRAGRLEVRVLARGRARGDRAAGRAPRTCDLVGLHSHIGSQLLELEPFRAAVRTIAALGDFPVYNLGGGLGVAYTAAQRPPAIADYVDAIVSTRARGARRRTSGCCSSPAARSSRTRPSRSTRSRRSSATSRPGWPSTAGCPTTSGRCSTARSTRR